MGYICDADGYHSNTSKVLKILDWPEYTDVTSTHIFIEVYGYYQI